MVTIRRTKPYSACVSFTAGGAADRERRSQAGADQVLVLGLATAAGETGAALARPSTRARCRRGRLTAHRILINPHDTDRPALAGHKTPLVS